MRSKASKNSISFFGPHFLLSRWPGIGRDAPIRGGEEAHGSNQYQHNSRKMIALSIKMIELLRKCPTSAHFWSCGDGFKPYERGMGQYREVPVRLWFAPSSEVPIYRQLVTQVVLAILSGDLRPGERLPSTRELARRFAINPNTVSAGYRQLEREGWT